MSCGHSQDIALDAHSVLMMDSLVGGGYEQRAYCRGVPCGVWSTYIADTLLRGTDSQRVVFNLRLQTLFFDQQDSNHYHLLYYDQGRLVSLVEFTSLGQQEEIVYNKKLYFKRFHHLYNVPLHFFELSRYEEGLMEFYKNCSSCHTFAVGYNDDMCAAQQYDLLRFERFFVSDPNGQHDTLKLSKEKIAHLHAFLTSMKCDTAITVPR